jgi:hypothetical protein
MGTYDNFVDQLVSNPEDRLCLKAVASGLESNPFAAGKIEAILHQLLQPAERPDGTRLTNEESLDFMSSWGSEALGIPADITAPALHAIGDIDFDEISTQEIEDAGLVEHVNASMKANPDAWLRASAEARKMHADALERLNAPKAEPSYWTDQDDARVMEIESKFMRAEPGSENWRQYYRGPVQSEYYELLTRKLAPEPLPEPEPAYEAVSE